MRTLCPNLDREDALETVLEVPIPEEIFANNAKNRSWHNMKSWMRPHGNDKSPTLLFGDRNTEIQLLLGVVGAPLVPLPIHSHHSFTKSFKDHPIVTTSIYFPLLFLNSLTMPCLIPTLEYEYDLQETSMAKYIVQQYIAAAGGENALNSIHSMCAVGKFKMATTEVTAGEGLNLNGKVMKIKTAPRNGAAEMGGFVLWQKIPDLWSLELMVSGCKISAGSNGKVAWRQTPWHHSHASRGPPRPLRRSLQA